jgi:hypothetical protein
MSTNDQNLNWFGIESHPTDCRIHWSISGKQRLKEAATLRAAYDKIIAAGLKDELDILTSAAYESGRQDECDNNNPDI